MGFDMKEYLRKNSNGKYIAEFVSEKEASEPHDAGWIEIPEGDTWAYKNSRGNIITMHGNVCQAFIGDLVWQRESPNDKLASAEQYRQAEVLPFIDDEPKNVEQGSIGQTLAQRQSQYGCFEDVALVTQGMIELMRKCNYDKMPASHQMALSMIASKMARIVNGDFNHKDSWHDIGGYARLIEDEILDETEMPF